VTLPPACLLYSPEYRPRGATGLVTLTGCAGDGGKERLELATVWADRSARPRLLPVAHWLILAACRLPAGGSRTADQPADRFRKLTWSEDRAEARASQPAPKKERREGHAWLGWLKPGRTKPGRLRADARPSPSRAPRARRRWG